VLTVAATTGPSVLWYLARGTGAVALLLLSTSVVLGVLNVQRLRTTRLPRFVVDGLHRSVSLLVLVVLGVHIFSSVLDSFAHISLVVPFTSGYRPIWLGLGTLAFELVIAVLITSLLRQRIGYRAWRAVHWMAYASWPLALVHGFGTGTDGKASWMLAITVLCVVAVIAAVLVRVASAWPADRRRRHAAGALVVTAPILLVIWLLDGPLAPGWAGRAGTPVALLGTRPALAASSRFPAALALPFTAHVAGRLTQTNTATGVTVDISLADTSGRAFAIRIVGQPSVDGGVAMTDSLVRVGTSRHPAVYRGRIVGLAGGNVTASLSDGRHQARLNAVLNINGAAVDGRTTLRPAA
jgi:hypothetical protein